MWCPIIVRSVSVQSLKLGGLLKLLVGTVIVVSVPKYTSNIDAYHTKIGQICLKYASMFEGYFLTLSVITDHTSNILKNYPSLELHTVRIHALLLRTKIYHRKAEPA